MCFVALWMVGEEGPSVRGSACSQKNKAKLRYCRKLPALYKMGMSRGHTKYLVSFFFVLDENELARRDSARLKALSIHPFPSTRASWRGLQNPEHAPQAPTGPKVRENVTMYRRVFCVPRSRKGKKRPATARQELANAVISALLNTRYNIPGHAVFTAA